MLWIILNIWEKYESNLEFYLEAKQRWPDIEREKKCCYYILCSQVYLTERLICLDCCSFVANVIQWMTLSSTTNNKGTLSWKPDVRISQCTNRSLFPLEERVSFCPSRPWGGGCFTISWLPWLVAVCITLSSASVFISLSSHCEIAHSLILSRTFVMGLWACLFDNLNLITKFHCFFKLGRELNNS